MKIVTAVSALKTLGPDKTFTTRVVSPAGKVAIIGGGDAALSRTGLAKLAQSLGGGHQFPTRPAARCDDARALPTSHVHPKGKRVKSTKKKPCKLVRPGPRRAVSVFVDDSYTPHQPTIRLAWGATNRRLSPGAPAGYRRRLLHGFVGECRWYWFGAEVIRPYWHLRRSRQWSRCRTTWHLLRARSPTRSDTCFRSAKTTSLKCCSRNVAVAKGYVPNWTNSSRAATGSLGSLGIPLSSVS